MKCIYPFGFLLTFLAFQTARSQYIQIDQTYTAQQLVEDVLIDSPCAAVSNFSLYSNPGGAPGYAYFTNDSPAFPFADGILLSTAPASLSMGPNNSLIDAGTTSWPGDADVQQSLNISPTYNATILEFDFLPMANKISFKYVFQSEEYLGTAPCHYSDGFAFLLRPAGSSDQYQNLAVIPGSTMPVKVTTVRPQISGNNGCAAANEEYFGGYNPTNYPTNYAAGTVAMTAQADVVPNTLYHIKLVIADHENPRYDSGIFLQGGSFSVGTNIGPNRLISTGNPVCEGNSTTLTVTEPGTHTYQWFQNGTPLLGQNGASYQVTAPGTYSVEVDLNNSGCIVVGEAVIEYVPSPQLTPATLQGCDPNGDGQAVYNLNDLLPLVIIGNPNDYNVSFFETSLDAQLATNPIVDPQAYLSGPATLFLRVSNQFYCTHIVSAQLQPISPSPLPSVSKTFCDDNQDGTETISLSTEITPLILTGLPAGSTVQYFASSADAEALSNPLDNSFVLDSPSPTVYAAVQTSGACYQIVSVNLQLLNFGPGFDDAQVDICAGYPEILSAPAGYASYLWSTGETTQSISVENAGQYSVTVTNSQGCSAIKTFHVSVAEPATIIGADIVDLNDGPYSVSVLYSGNGNYEFSLDGFAFQHSPVFSNVAAGTYDIFIRETSGCGISGPYPIVVLGYPAFFTPNGDGFNDFWRVENLAGYPQAKIDIFDRYGKLLHRLNTGSPGWDGRFNGLMMPSSDYWFVLDLGNGRIVKSHFSLKR